MKLYIQVQDGRPVGHPATEENLREAFPGINLDDPACGFEEFRRVPPPPCGLHHVLEDMVYMKVGGVYIDVYPIRNMTPSELAEWKARARKQWIDDGQPASWTLDEQTLQFVPPVPMPNDRTRLWAWDEPSLSWIDVTPEL